ncbi:MAG: agmatine deiminase family protein [Proteobacteria bacterium]|nr:agmatine deiminase family protein [Pseudomonadota bacterium]
MLGFKMSYLALAVSMVAFSNLASAVNPDQKNLPIGLSPNEMQKIGPLERLDPGPAPTAPIHSLGEWEDSEGVMTLWNNPSWIKALATRGAVKLLADDNSGVDWWKRFLDSNQIPSQTVSYFVVPTDSIWVRDYGPWFIIDGLGKMGIVDTKYNRPRPTDDKVPQFIGRTLNIPVYTPGLVHTGGNYYNDGIDRAFSSTLVYSENSSLSKQEVNTRMKDFLGINEYITSPLAPRITIEHMDTFGKLVSPDTWVFSDFPQGSKYRADSERFVALLQTMKSPYGTPYRILRMPMVSSSGRDDNYRAYINSFISNNKLYFPIYNAESDNVARKIYSEALPGYEIVGVSAEGTEWGDSVHCRSRNLLTRDALFIFPSIDSANLRSSDDTLVSAKIIPSPDAVVESARVEWTVNGVMQPSITMVQKEQSQFEAHIPAQSSGSKIEFFIASSDSRGKSRVEPRAAALKPIMFVIP